MASLANEFKALRGVVTRDRGEDSPGLLERRANRQPLDPNAPTTVESRRPVLRKRPKDKADKDPWGGELKYSKAVGKYERYLDAVDPRTNRDALELRDGELTATDLESGAVRWKTRLYEGDDRYGGVVRIGKDVQVIDRQRGRLVGIDPESGRILWTQEISKRKACLHQHFPFKPVTCDKTSSPRVL